MGLISWWLTSGKSPEPVVKTLGGLKPALDHGELQTHGIITFLYLLTLGYFFAKLGTSCSSFKRGQNKCLCIYAVCMLKLTAILRRLAFPQFMSQQEKLYLLLILEHNYR
jgi:hypothetical protein